MKCVTVTLLLLAVAGNISAGGSRHARESSGSYSGYINGKHYGGSYRTPDNGPTTFNHYGDDAARSAGVLPYGGRNPAASEMFGSHGFGSPVPHFSNPPEMENFNQAYNQFRTLSNTLASENMPARRRIVMSPSSDSTGSFARESYSYDNSRRSMPEMESFPFTRPQLIQVMPPTRTVSMFPNREDYSFPPTRSQGFHVIPPTRTRTVSRFPDTEVDSFPSTRSQEFQVMLPTRTVSRYPDTEDRSYVPGQGFAMPQQTPISTTTPEPMISDFPTEAPRTNSSANASIQFPKDGKPSPLQKRLLEQKLAWDAAQKVKEATSYDSKASNDNAPQASASASGSIGPDGGHQSVNIYPENAESPNINTRFPSDGPQPGGFYEVSSSSSSSYSNVNGETVYDKKAQTTVNDNGKVTTYVASD